MQAPARLIFVVYGVHVSFVCSHNFYSARAIRPRWWANGTVPLTAIPRSAALITGSVMMCGSGVGKINMNTVGRLISLNRVRL